MSINSLKYTPEEFAIKGAQIYGELGLSELKPEYDGKIVAIDIETGQFELADTTLEAAAKMFDRLPNAQLWFERIGSAILIMEIVLIFLIARMVGGPILSLIIVLLHGW
jgi:hypothetical protein